MTEYKATDLVKVIKLIPGTLILSFQNVLEYGNERSITIPANAEFTRIPLSLAASMFQLDKTYRLYKGGYFTFDKQDKEKVFAYARELQIYYGDDDSGKNATFEQKNVLYTNAEITQFVKLGRLKEINIIIEQGSRPQIELLIAVARENAAKMNYELIKNLEEKLGVEIVEGDA